MHQAHSLTSLISLLTAVGLSSGSAQAAAPDNGISQTPPTSSICSRQPAATCWHSLDLPGESGQMHYYASRTPADGGRPRSALLVMHGHPRDANHSFDAGLQAAQAAGRLNGADDDVLVVAPLYPVDAQHAGKCSTAGVPAAQSGDALWTCASWMAGQPSQGANPIGSFAALDALMADMHRQWPSLQNITVAGFSAGAQMIQRSVAFAASPPDGLQLHYVIADPGSWLYFDPVRPQARSTDGQQNTASLSDEYDFVQPDKAACSGYDQWKYGVQDLPTILGSNAAKARERYRAASIHYLEGALDTGTDKSTHYRVLDRSCAANLQGPYRLQRGQAYAAYDATILKPLQAHPLTIVPGCAHDVRCVLPSIAARAALFPGKASSEPK